MEIDSVAHVAVEAKSLKIQSHLLYFHKRSFENNSKETDLFSFYL